MKTKIIKVSLVIIWMILIFCFSNQKATESSKLSDGLIKNTISRIINDDSKETIKKFTKPVRKCAHFFVYLILGILVINCFDINKKYILYSIIICLLYSISDEIHQIFVEGRSCEVLDVMIDTLGSSLGVYINYKKRRNKLK